MDCVFCHHPMAAHDFRRDLGPGRGHIAGGCAPVPCTACPGGRCEALDGFGIGARETTEEHDG